MTRMLLVTLEDPKNQPFTGKRMSEPIKARGGDPIDVLFDVPIEGRRQRRRRVHSPHESGRQLWLLAASSALVLDNGRHTNAMPGKVIPGPGYQRR